MTVSASMTADRLAGRLMLFSAVLFAIVSATILSAHAFERIGYPPCPLCLQQRYAYYFAVPSTVIAFFTARAEAFTVTRILLALIALAFLINAGLGIYHSGIEWKWWEGPSSCAGGTPVEWGSGLGDQLQSTAVIRCDEAPWRFLGLSFAGWNASISALLAGIAAYAASERR